MRNSKNAIVENIMAKVSPIIKNALNESIFDEDIDTKFTTLVDEKGESLILDEFYYWLRNSYPRELEEFIDSELDAFGLGED